MGCSPSSHVEADIKPAKSNTVSPSNSNTLQNGVKVHTDIPNKHETNTSPKKKQAPPAKEHNNNNVLQREKTGVAFEIGFERNIDSLIAKHPPKRLQHLAPLPDSAPKLTSDQLEEKLRLAEENRLKELEKKKSVSRRSNRLRQEVMRAREEEKQQEQKELDEKLMSADRARQKKQQELVEKKRQREERARKAREKAARLKAQGGDELDYELEKDDGFNQDDDDDYDSWLDGENNTSDYHTDNDRFNSGTGDSRFNSGNHGDHVYNGRTSPSKGLDQHKSPRMFSASTTDSYDYAFQREPAKTKSMENSQYDRTKAVDDFFDS